MTYEDTRSTRLDINKQTKVKYFKLIKRTVFGQFVFMLHFQSLNTNALKSLKCTKGSYFLLILAPLNIYSLNSAFPEQHIKGVFIKIVI